MKKKTLICSLLILSFFLLNSEIIAQKPDLKTLAGEWYGYDNKGQRVTLNFTPGSALQTICNGDTTEFNYKIETSSQQVYLKLTPKGKSSAKIKWPVAYDGRNQLKIHFPLDGNLSIYDYSIKGSAPAILFTRMEKEKIKIFRYATYFADSTIHNTTVISFANDSVKAVEIIRKHRPIQNNMTGNAGNQSPSSDQLELSSGWGGGHNATSIVEKMYPSSNTAFFVDSFIVEIPSGFPLMIRYELNNKEYFFRLNKRDFVHPGNVETAVGKLKQFEKLCQTQNY